MARDQDEGYSKGLQGLAWETPVEAPPSLEDAAASFLHDVRTGAVALRGRLKRHSPECFQLFETGFFDSFPEAKGKPFARALSRLWIRWLGPLSEIPNEKVGGTFSFETGRRLGGLLKREYEEGVSGNLAGFLLDKRLHLNRVRDFLRMRGWFLGTIERLRRDADPDNKERAEILNANFSSIVLRALHNAGPGYAAEAVSRLGAMLRDLDAAISNLASIEPEAARHLKNNRSTIITRALHSGMLDYGDKATTALPSALKDLNRRLDILEASSPQSAEKIRATQRTRIYRALTNGRLKSPL